MCQFLIGARALGIDGGKARVGFARAFLQYGQLLADLGELTLFFAPELAQAALLGFRTLGGLGGSPLGIDPILGLRQNLGGPAIQLQQAVLVGQPLGCGRDAMGGGNKAVPTPQITLTRDEPLAGLQVRLQPSALLTRDDADLAQPARQLRRSLHVHDQRFGVRRQRMVLQANIEGAPVDARLRRDWRVQVVAKSCTKRGLVTGCDADLIDDWREFALVGGRQQFGNRFALGGEGVGGKADTRRIIAPRAGFGLCDFARLLGGERLRLDLADLGGQTLSGFRDDCELLCVGRVLLDLPDLSIEPFDLAGNLADDVLALRKCGLKALQPGSRFRGLVRDLCKARFGFAPALVGFLGLLARGFLLRVLGHLGFALGLKVGLQANERLQSFADEAVLAGDIGFKLTCARFQFLGAAHRTLGFPIDVLTFDFETRERGGFNGLLFAQGGHGFRQRDFMIEGLRIGFRGGAKLRHGLRKRTFFVHHRLLRRAPGQVQQKCLCLADLGRNLLVAARLPRLPFQALRLRVHLAEDVIEARKVGLGGFQAQFRFVAAGMETRNARGVFQNAAALLGLGIDDLADLALANESGRSRAGRGVLKQHFDVARAHLLAIDAVGRARLALDAAGDFQHVVSVELGGSLTCRIVEKHGDFGAVTRGAAGRAGEDHVVHGGRTHGFVRRLAHHPAERFKEVRFSAPVGAHDAGKTRLDQKLGGFDERLEAQQPQSRNFHFRSSEPAHDTV